MTLNAKQSSNLFPRPNRHDSSNFSQIWESFLNEIILFRLLHTNGFTDEEMNQQKTVIYNNIVQGMACILRGMKKLDIQFENSERDVGLKSKFLQNVNFISLKFLILYK